MFFTAEVARDGARCLLQPNFHAPRDTPRLFHNLANGRFEDVTRAIGLDRCYGTFQVLAEDLDSDGWPDLVMVNVSLDAERLEPSVVLHNLRGTAFKEWFFLPAFAPTNLIGVAVWHDSKNSTPRFYLAANSLFKSSISTTHLAESGVSAKRP